MRPIEELGFQRVRRISPEELIAFSQKTGFKLPADYIQFMEYVTQTRKVFGFTFQHSGTGEEWEGQVAEFVDNYPSLDTLERTLIRSENDVLLPIANDAGGNFIYLNLTRSPQPIVDQDYQSGFLSVIAPSFGDFLDKLYEIE